MPFRKLQIRYQTARSLPAPYAHFYTLTLNSDADRSLRVDLTLTYPDRDDIDDDELIAEGYTRDDDFSWSGRLPQAWLKTLEILTDTSRLRPVDEESLAEDDDFWAITIERAGTRPEQGQPANPDEWQYMVQELIQASYESIGRERPFTLTYLNLNGQDDEFELRLTASFVERNVRITRIQHQQERNGTLPWSMLQHVMTVVYTHDYVAEDALSKRPRRDGKWLNLGSDEWHDIAHLPDLVHVLRNL